jgi:hypothetical protein
VSAPLPAETDEHFAASRALFDSALGFLDGARAAGLEHVELETELQVKGRELLRQLMQDHLDARARREQRQNEVTDAEGVGRGAVEAGHQRTLTTVFGEVTVTRLAYRARGHANLHPADAALNLPIEKHSHGLRLLAAIEASRGSFDGAVDAIERATGVRLGKRQVEQLATSAAADFDTFYNQRRPPPSDTSTDPLVLSYDGKGVVMRRDGLRPATAKAAAAATGKLATRLSKGEKRNRKRLAEVGVVYDAAPRPRGPADILAATEEQRRAARPGPRAANKWLTASVTDNAAAVIGQVFDEADRRDPDHQRRWIALVDGNKHQIDRTHTEAQARGIDVAIVVDFVHVLEYLWAAAWCFFTEADPAAETWVRRQALAVLHGKATTVAAAIRRRATTAGLTRTRRKNADDAATYLVNKAPYLDYPTALKAGWPIATGVIEGACRHLVKDRMDLTGARWGLPGAEAILKLRAIRSNADFHEYQRHHLAQERRRVHETRYFDGIIPHAA